MMACPCCRRPTTMAVRLPMIRSRLLFGDRTCRPCRATYRRDLIRAVEEEGAMWPACSEHPEAGARGGI